MTCTPVTPDANGWSEFKGRWHQPVRCKTGRHDWFEVKTKDDPEVWTDFIKLCKVLNETPANKLVTALAPLPDIDGALKFLALENALINNNGYWIRASD